MKRLRSALWFPLFDELVDPVAVARIAAAAEEAGWDGVFVWDHINWRAPVQAVADPWITMAAMASATERLRIGPMVTPLARRRPTKMIRETVTLDQLSGGRLTLGVGLGSDRFGQEFSKTGEQEDDRARAGMLDEFLGVLTAGWSGEPVNHRGEYYVVDDIAFQPRPVNGRIPVWVAGFPGKRKPVLRAARYDGFFPVNLEHPDELAEAVAAVLAAREVHLTQSAEPGSESLQDYDIAVALPPDADVKAFAEAGATWWLAEFDLDTITLDTVYGVLADGPADN